MAKIAVASGETIVCEMTLATERISIGRGRHNDVVVDSPAISSEHAAIMSVNGDWLLEDLDSTNGTKVNGQPVRKHFLQDGDLVELAHYTIRYMLGTRKNNVCETTHDDIFAKSPNGIAAIQVLSGPKKGESLLLNKPLITIGQSETDTAVISRRSEGYFIAHVHGTGALRVNDKVVRSSAHRVVHGDVIDIAGTKMRFLQR